MRVSKSMIFLKKQFSSGAGGFSQEPLTYTLITRNNIAAVYERSRNGKIRDYEVFKIKVIPKGTVIFNSVPSSDDEERYPSTGDFGKIAWSFHGQCAKDAAIKKFHEISELKEKNPKIKTWQIPDKDFTINDVAALNNSNYISASNFVKENLNKTLAFAYEKRLNVKGKASKFYKKI